MNILNQFNLTKVNTSEISTLYKGSINWQNEFELDIDWIMEGDFSDRYRKVWFSVEQKSIFTYCEGDLTLEVFDSKSVFYKALSDAAKFYESR